MHVQRSQVADYLELFGPKSPELQKELIESVIFIHSTLSEIAD